MNGLLSAAIVLAFIALVIWQMVVSVRDLRKDPDERAMMLTLIAVLCVMVPACLVVERFAVGPQSSERSPVVRQVSGGLGLVVWMAISVRRISRRVRHERAMAIRERDAFAEGKSCISCGGALNLGRLHHPFNEKGSVIGEPPAHGDSPLTYQSRAGWQVSLIVLMDVTWKSMSPVLCAAPLPMCPLTST